MSADVQKKQKYIYVMLSKTYTMPARMIRLVTGEPYSHTSIALDKQLTELYSFARKGIYNPLNSGFVIEDLERGVFGMDQKITCSVYAVPVTDEQYEMLKTEIGRFVDHADDYGYNYVGLFTIMFGMNIYDGKHFFCSQFVSYLFSKCGMPLFSKEHGLIRPYDFHRKLKAYRIYKGKLSEYREALEGLAYEDVSEEDYYYEDYAIS